MSDYCVIIRGRLPGDRDEESLWAPIARSLQLDQVTFATRVLAALPLIVQRRLDRDAAASLVDSLEQAGVDACAVADDVPLVYLERDGGTRGPIPLSALGQFIQPGERYRLRDTREWERWLSVNAAEEHESEVLPPPPALTNAQERDQAVDQSTSTAPDDGEDTPSPTDDTVDCQSMADVKAVDLSAGAVSRNSSPSDQAAPSLLLADNYRNGDGDGAGSGAIRTDADSAQPNLGRRILLPVGRTRLSIAAGYLGLLAVIPLIAPLTLVVSILAWRGLRGRRHMHGRGRTLFGLIMGIGGTILLIVGATIGYRSMHHVNVRERVTTTSRATAKSAPAASFAGTAASAARLRASICLGSQRQFIHRDAVEACRADPG